MTIGNQGQTTTKRNIKVAEQWYLLENKQRSFSSDLCRYLSYSLQNTLVGNADCFQ